MRIFFASSSNIALEVLREVNKYYEIVGVLSPPDKPQGRGQKLLFNVIKEEAMNLNLKVIAPITLDQYIIELVRTLKPELMIVFAYGKIFKKEFLDIFPNGAINIHPSLLPKYRGPSPIQTAILNGDTISGITVQKLALKMDSGNILVQEAFKIHPKDTSSDIFEYVKIKSPSLTLCAIEKIKRGELGTLQDETQATFCFFLKKETSEIDFNLGAFEIKNKINACNPWPMSRATLDNNLIIIFHKVTYMDDKGMYSNSKNGEIVGYDLNKGILVKTGEGILVLLILQQNGKKPLDYKSFYNGNRTIIGKIFS